ncbi:unnamed protein product, partial [Gongylonema pulchrum]|uniref:Uncharacterized protein n=1 Tax=Gongylonema pulchrum TaxID=637853 RepID=A0A183DB29_9BILA
MNNEEQRGGDGADVLPPALFARPSVRRGSVFSDLLTIFRRNSSHPHRLFHAARPSVSTSDEQTVRETEAFLEPNAAGQGQGQQDEEPEEDGK